MRKTTSKLLTLILTLAIIFSMVPISSVAAASDEAKIGEDYYATLKEAIAAVEQEQKITLLHDITPGETIELGNTRADTTEYTLDLGDYTINGPTASGSAITLSSSKTVNLIASEHGGAVNNASSYSAIGVKSASAKLNIYGGTYKGNVLGVALDAAVAGYGFVVITSGVFIGYERVAFYGSSRITITPGSGVTPVTGWDSARTVTVVDLGPEAAIGSKEYGTLVAAITDVRQGEKITLLHDITLGETIELGKTRADTTEYTLDLGDYTINGPTASGSAITLSSSKTVNLIASEHGGAVNNASSYSAIGVKSASAKLNIYGGTYKGNVLGVALNAAGAGYGFVVITSGVFIGYERVAFYGSSRISFAPDSVVTPVTDWDSARTVTVESKGPEAAIGSKNYLMLADAIADVGQNQTITLLRNIKVNSSFLIDLTEHPYANGVTAYKIDLGNCKISGNYSSAVIYMHHPITVSIIAGSGGIENTNVYGAAFFITHGATINIRGGTYIGGDDSIYCPGGTVVITDGVFIAANDNDSNGSLVANSSGTIAIAFGSAATPATDWNTATTVTVTDSIPPVFTTHPTNKSVTSGDAVTISAEANFTNYYRWQVNTGSGWGIVPNNYTYSGAATNTLVISNASMSMNGYQYRCVATNEIGSTESNAATLTVSLPTSVPAVAMDPVDRSVVEGLNTEFRASASAQPTPTYQWQVDTGSGWINLSNGGIYSGATTGTLTLTGVIMAMTGYQYRCVATNSRGSATTKAATLTVRSSAKSITVGEQTGIMRAKENNSVSFYAATMNVPAGYYPITFNNLPTGVTVSSTIILTYAGALFELGGSSSTVAGTYNNITLSIDGVTSAPFTLTITPQNTVTISTITGVTAPVLGASSVVSGDATEEFTTSVQWCDERNNFLGYNITFDADKVYRAVVSVYAKPGYSLEGIPVNFFTVEGAFKATSTESYIPNGGNESNRRIDVSVTFAPTSSAAGAPVFTVHPTDAEVERYGTVTLTATATGAVSYKWQYMYLSTYEDLTEGGAVGVFGMGVSTNVNTNTLTISDAIGAAYYRCVATNANGYTGSTTAMVDAVFPSVTYSVDVTVNKDGTAWSGFDKEIALYRGDSPEYYSVRVDGKAVFEGVANGTYKVYDHHDEIDTGVTVTVSGADASAALDYYTLRFHVINAGTASGSTIAATYDGDAVTSGAAVLGGKTFTVIATGAGASAYDYDWSGTATSATANYTTTVSSAVNAVCSVTGRTTPTITSGNTYTCENSTGGAFALTATGTTPITWTLSGTVPTGVSVSGNALVVSPATAAGIYSFTVNAANGTSPNATQSFTLIVGADTTKPVVYFVTPYATGADLNDNVIITFSEAMNTTSGTVQLNSLTALSGGAWYGSNTVYTIPYSGLENGTVYTVNISGFKDAAGNTMDSDSTNSFTTVAAATADLSVSVTTPTIVETLAAYLNITVTGEAIESMTLTAYLDVGGELRHAAAIKNGSGRMYIDAAPEAGDYELVIIAEDKSAAGSCKIDVVKYNNDIWVMNTTVNAEGYVILVFNETISAKDGKFDKEVSLNAKAVKPDGKAVTCKLGDDGKSLVTNVKYDELAAGDNTFTVTGVKYAKLFPSYSFTFTADFNK